MIFNSKHGTGCPIISCDSVHSCVHLTFQIHALHIAVLATRPHSWLLRMDHENTGNPRIRDQWS